MSADLAERVVARGPIVTDEESAWEAHFLAKDVLELRKALEAKNKKLRELLLVIVTLRDLEELHAAKKNVMLPALLRVVRAAQAVQKARDLVLPENYAAFIKVLDTEAAALRALEEVE